MENSLANILEQMRLRSQSQFEKGEYFEKLVKVFLENDALQGQTYDKVWLFKDWASEHDLPSNDTGIDLVARHADGAGFCAIQCKFYAADSSISKKHMDSFVSAASSKYFVSLIIVDTTLKDFSSNLTAMLDNLDRDWHRIALSDLEKSRIDWSAYFRDNTVKLTEPKILRDHQREALEAVRAGLVEADRGKLVMACGTGKTFTGLKIAEELGGKGKLILYMVPSLALMSQTVREWKNDCADDFLAFSVCSDVKVGKRESDGDAIQFTVHDLAFPATTDASKIAQQVADSDREKMIVVFSTYQSIQVLTDAQKTYCLPEFDWIICDEAHRTTGETIGTDESNFVKIHSNDNVAGKKRVYMTATPKIYGENAKSKAAQHDVALASMDDPDMFGELLFYRGFSWAVENDLLSDYKVIVLAVDEGLISAGVQNRLAESSEMKLDDATKIIGCYKALIKRELIGEDTEDPAPMKCALAFCKNIAVSKMVTEEFAAVVDEYRNNDDIGDLSGPSLDVQTRHVDGTYNAKQREDCLDWLKAETDDETCRILTNARCLSEGVDVPALDAIIFMHPRKSQIDVVQSIGRVMRKAPGKEMGYVILPVAIPHGTAAEDALNDNERYQVVWQILNALRSHDERLDGKINQIGIGEDVSDKIQIIGVTKEMMATTAVVEDIDVNKTKASKRSDIGGGSGDSSDDEIVIEGPEQQLGFVFDELTQALRAKIVEKCGTREHWDKWAKDIAKIAETHITRITTIVAHLGAERDAFVAFLDEIRDDLNPEISEQDAIEMLAQHLITKPVFDTLFRDNHFTANNPVSKAMEIVLGQLHHHNIGKEAETLQGFYDSVRRQSEGIKTASGRQALVVRLYDQFFRSAFPAMTQKLGIVYTPVEVVDFIIHSVNDVLQSEFGQTLGSKGVHILDPFTGTGTFITRLLQSGLIKPEELEHKYKHEIHANEIVLLAYYIAAINIEAVYHDIAKENAVALGNSGEDMPYAPFDGIVLTDTFQLYEQDKDMIADLLPDNSERRTAQKERDIRVIVGNPPYSGGQRDENDDAANIDYFNLDEKIHQTYAAKSRARLKTSLKNSYIRSIRWASDRLTDVGVVAFVTDAGWIDGNAMDGMRKCLTEEFSDLYIFHLRGNQRTSGETSRKEGGKVFLSGSRSPIAISVLVKKGDNTAPAKINFCTVDDYLTQKEKLQLVRSRRSIAGISEIEKWKVIQPNDENDWLNQRDPSFENSISIGSKVAGAKGTIFSNYSSGAKTNRDFWCFNYSKSDVSKNMERMVNFYNDQVKLQGDDLKGFRESLDAKLISWDGTLKSDLKKLKRGEFSEEKIMLANYRPFQRQWFYFDRQFNNSVYQMNELFPAQDAFNRTICVTGVGEAKDFSALMANNITEHKYHYNSQCFPLKLYEPASAEDGLFATGEAGYSERDGISDAGLKHFQAAYPGEQISKEDLFYYIYGLLHSADYRERFKNNLSKELPRIPAVKTAVDFWAFSKAGRALGDLHVNYETVEPYPVVIAEGDLRLANIEDPETFYHVEKMKFGGKGKVKDKTVVHYNPRITIKGIPLEAYDYVVNGKPALDWVIERQCVKTDKASGIVNDANRYAIETVGNPAYPLELFQRVITVSLETIRIVDGLPALEID
ncbi:Predicted helicase [Sulfitobacter litoralis]|uniref:Predicted helicase n=1 Tax=Sulfitobacter litoralis TaxID=335975 RepID=A0ABY0SJ14_9RHOB|nr:type ISP restriction/modification enzyme [Sulfitobacter litoralis]SDP29140.1 Predicted helicase [Sulfitobacter litoralis]